MRPNDSLSKFMTTIIWSTFLCLMIMFVSGASRAALAQISPTNSFTWDIQRVDAPKLFSNMTDRSLRLDANGNPHIAYGGDYLYYAWHDGTQWHIETVDTSEGVGSYASLALDVNGNPHISYYDTTNRDLKYACRTQNSWEIQTVVGNGSIGSSTSIDLDENDYPHIGYSSWDNYVVKYARWTGSIWEIQTVDQLQIGNIPRYVSLVAGRNSTPHISYVVDGSLKYATWAGESWRIQTIVTYTDSLLWSTSLTLDSNDNPHIAYHHNGFCYARWTGSGWDNQTVDYSSDMMGYYSLVLDANDNPHVSYYIGWIQYFETGQDLKYARWTGNGWELQTLDTDGNVGYWNSLALDNNGNPHITYFNNDTGFIKYTRRTESSWETQIVDKAGKAGLYPSLALDQSNCPHISYLDTSYGELKFAHWTGSAWDIQVVDSSSFTGYFTSLVLDSYGYPHISYYDLIYGDLRYARWTGISWEIQTVDSPAEGSLYTVGWYTSLALDMNDNPHISYFDENAVAVKYAHWTGTNWDIQVIDRTNALWTKYTSIAVDSQNRPHITYQYYLGGKYARWTGSNWDIQTVDTGWGIWNSSLALDAYDNAHISYCKIYYNDAVGLTYAHWTGSVWDIQELERGAEWSNGLGYFSSIFLDSKGNPHISYYDRADKKLKYARYTGLTWDIQSVDNGVDVGMYTSIALDGNDNPHIAYYDNYMGDLKYAKGTLVGPDISISPSKINFNNVFVGNSKDQTITIRNDGAANLIVGTIESPSFPFATVGGTCTDGMTLVPAMSCSLVVRFAPDTPGPFSSTFNITSNDADENSVNINLTGTGVAIVPYTITSIPEGLQLKVDGSIFTSPVVVNWSTGSTHTIEAISPQAESGGSRLTFSSWSDGGAQNHTVLTPFSSTNYTANFVLQYTLTTSVDPPGVCTVYPSGTTWHDKDKVIYVSTPNNNIYYDFSHWSGDLSGSANPTYFTIDRPMSVVAIYVSKSKNISVSSPNGGEAWAAGSTQTIRWSYGGNPGSFVKIELLKGGVAKSTISHSAPIGSDGTGSYNWPIPFAQTPGSDYQIKITSTNNGSYTDTSDNNFAIVGKISLVSPNGGGTLTVGSTQTIRWSYGGNPGSFVKIELLKGGLVNRTVKSFTSIGSGGNGSCNWTIPSTQATGSDYKIRITSTSNGSYTDTSDTDFTIVGPPPPPANVSASDGTYMDKVEVTWSASPGATSYTVYRSTSLYNWATKTALGTTSNTAYDDSTASVMKNYYYWVKASNAYGTSGFSGSNAGYRSDGRPPAPTNVSASDGTYMDKVEVTWTVSPGATSYTVYRSTSLYNWATKTALGTTSETSLIDSTATPGRTYYYWVKASNTYGTSNFSGYDSGYR